MDTATAFCVLLSCLIDQDFTYRMMGHLFFILNTAFGFWDISRTMRFFLRDWRLAGFSQRSLSSRRGWIRNEMPWKLKCSSYNSLFVLKVRSYWNVGALYETFFLHQSIYVWLFVTLIIKKFAYIPAWADLTVSDKYWVIVTVFFLALGDCDLGADKDLHKLTRNCPLAVDCMLKKEAESIHSLWRSFPPKAVWRVEWRNPLQL